LGEKIMNEIEKTITMKLIEDVKEDHTPIPNKLIDLVCEVDFEGVGIAIELVGLAFDSVLHNPENGWQFNLSTPAKRGDEIYSKDHIEKIAEILKNASVIKSYNFDEEANFTGFLNIEFLFSDMITPENNQS
jgi:hypothetical protein